MSDNSTNTKQHLEEIQNRALLNFSKIKLLSSFDSHFYKDFPSNISDDIMEAVGKEMGVGFAALFEHLFLDKKIETDSGSRVGKSFAYLNYALASDDKGKEFEQLILQQEWITYFVYLEGFFQDINKFLFSIDKSLLAHEQKTISWSEVVNADSYDKLISSMIDNSLEKSGYKNNADLIETWNRPPYKLCIKIKKLQLAMLRWAITVRNVIIHNNGRANIDYIRTIEDVYKLSPGTERIGIKSIGEVLDLDDAMLSGIFALLIGVVEETSQAVSLKYFSTKI